MSVAYVPRKDIKIEDLGVANINMRAVRKMFLSGGQSSIPSQRRLLSEPAAVADPSEHQKSGVSMIAVVWSAACLTISALFALLYLRKFWGKGLVAKGRLAVGAETGSCEPQANQEAEARQS